MRIATVELFFLLPLCLWAQTVDVRSLINRADEAFKRGDVMLAESLYRRALQVQPENADLYTSLANILATENRWAEAGIEAETAIRLAPKDPEALTTMAKLQTRFHRNRDAIELFRRVVAVAPEASDAHLNLGIALAETRDQAAALSEFTDAVRLAPSSAEAHYNRGRVLVELHRFQEAETELKSADALSPTSTETLYLLAVVESQFERHTESLKLLDEAITADPNNVDANYLRGQELEGVGRHAEAIAEWKRTIELRPDHTGALYNLFRHLRTTHPAEAAKYGKRFKTAQSQQEAKALNDAATGLAAQGRSQEAISKMKESLMACGSCSFLSELDKNLGLIYAGAGNYRDAQNELHKALQRNPNDPEVQAALERVEKLIESANPR